jgi:hypothetical protein
VSPEHALWGWWWAQRSNRYSDADYWHGWLTGWLAAGGVEPKWDAFGPTRERWAAYRGPVEPPVWRLPGKRNTHPE